MTGSTPEYHKPIAVLLWISLILNSITGLSWGSSDVYRGATAQGGVCPSSLEEVWMSYLPQCNEEPCAEWVWTSLL